MVGCCRRLAAAALIISALGACSEQTTDGGSVIVSLEPVIGLAAYSAGVSTVGLRWTASPSALQNEMQDHRVFVRSIPGGSILATYDIPRTDTAMIVPGLSEGVTYRFDVVVRPTASATDKGESPPATIRWAPARRFPVQTGGTSLRVYESAGGSFPSGLIMFADSVPRATVLQNPTPLADTLLIDLYLFTVNSSTLVMRSAHLYSGRLLPRRCRFSSVVHDENSLEDPAQSPPDSSTYSASNTSVAVTSAGVATSRIHFVRSGDAQYARILLVRQSNGTLIGGTAPDRFVELEVSYQITPNQLYARRR